MKLPRVIFVVLIFVLAGFIGLGLFLSPQIKVERSIVIEAPAKKILPFLENLELWSEWTPWNESHYPGMQRQLGPVTVGDGATMSWKGPEVGEGTLQLTGSSPEEGVSYELSMEDGRMKVYGTITLEENAGLTSVTWRDTGDGGFAARFLGGMIEDAVGADFDRGLKKLKTRVEAGD